MLGTAIKRACIAIFNPLFLVIILNGRRTLTNLNTFTTFSFPLVITIDSTDIVVTKKSIPFSPDLKYDSFPLKRKPVEIIFNNTSNAKNDVITKSDIFRNFLNTLLGLVKGFSRASNILWMRIKKRMNLSKNSLRTILITITLTHDEPPKINRLLPYFYYNFKFDSYSS